MRGLGHFGHLDEGVLHLPRAVAEDRGLTGLRAADPGNSFVKFDSFDNSRSKGSGCGCCVEALLFLQMICHGRSEGGCDSSHGGLTVAAVSGSTGPMNHFRSAGRWDTSQTT